MTSRQKKRKSLYGDDNAPVYRPMADIMKTDFVYNKAGNVWLLHDKPLPGKLEWVEYDADLENVSLVIDTGKTQNLGLDVPVKRGLNMENVTEIKVLQMNGGKIVDHAIVPILFRHTALH